MKIENQVSIRLAVIDALNEYRENNSRETIPAKAFNQISQRVIEILKTRSATKDLTTPKSKI